MTDFDNPASLVLLIPLSLVLIAIAYLLDRLAKPTPKPQPQPEPEKPEPTWDEYVADCRRLVDDKHFFLEDFLEKWRDLEIPNKPKKMTKERLAKYKADPLLFMKDLFGLEPTAYQKKILRGDWPKPGEITFQSNDHRVEGIAPITTRHGAFQASLFTRDGVYHFAFQGQVVPVPQLRWHKYTRVVVNDQSATLQGIPSDDAQAFKLNSAIDETKHVNLATIRVRRPGVVIPEQEPFRVGDWVRVKFAAYPGLWKVMEVGGNGLCSKDSAYLSNGLPGQDIYWIRYADMEHAVPKNGEIWEWTRTECPHCSLGQKVVLAPFQWNEGAAYRCTHYASCVRDGCLRPVDYGRGGSRRKYNILCGGKCDPVVGSELCFQCMKGD